MTHRTLPRSKGAHRPTFFQFSDSAVAPRWCIAMIWSWGGLSRSRGFRREGKAGQKRAGFVSRKRPAPSRPFPAVPSQKRKTPAKRARVYRRMGEGLGAGGTPPGAVGSTLRRRPGFLCPKLFSRPCAARTLAAVRARPMGDVGWQLDSPPVGKLEISQMDAKGALSPARTFDHVASADRKPARETVCEGSHAFLLAIRHFLLELVGTNAGSSRQFRDSWAANADFCEPLWTGRRMCWRGRGLSPRHRH